MLQEVTHILQPGGLFISNELGSYPMFHPFFNLTTRTHLPGATRFFNVVNVALRTRGIQCIVPAVSDLLAGCGSFTDITPQHFHMPVVPWHPNPHMQSLGMAFRAALRKYTESVRPMLSQAGWADWAMDQIINDFLHETMRP
jgi:hypothetical protein